MYAVCKKFWFSRIHNEKKIRNKLDFRDNVFTKRSLIFKALRSLSFRLKFVISTDIWHCVLLNIVITTTIEETTTGIVTTTEETTTQPITTTTVEATITTVEPTTLITTTPGLSNKTRSYMFSVKLSVLAYLLGVSVRFAGETKVKCASL